MIPYKVIFKYLGGSKYTESTPNMFRKSVVFRETGQGGPRPEAHPCEQPRSFYQQSSPGSSALGGPRVG